MTDDKKTLGNVIDIVQNRMGVEPYPDGEIPKDFDPGNGEHIQRMLATMLAGAIEENDKRTETRIQDVMNVIKVLEKQHGEEVLRTRALELIRRPNPVDRANGAILLDHDITVETFRSIAAQGLPGVVKGTPGGQSIQNLKELNDKEIALIKKSGLMDAELGVWSGTHPDYHRKGCYNPHIIPITPRDYYAQQGVHIRTDETTTTLAYFVPVLYGSLIYTYAWEANPFRAGGATVLNVPYSTGKFPLLTAGYTAAYRAEAAAVTATQLTDAQLSYTNLNYSVYTIITKDILASADIGVTMVAMIIQEMGKAMGTKEATMGITGTGSSLWYGLDSIAAANIHAEDFTGSKLLNAFINADGELGSGVKDSSWRNGAGWIIPGRVETVLKGMTYGSTSNPVGYVFPVNEGITSLISKPVAYNQNLWSGGKGTAYEYVRPLYYITQEPKMTTLRFDDSGRTNVSENEAVFFLNMKTQGQPATRSLTKAHQAAVKVTNIANPV